MRRLIGIAVLAVAVVGAVALSSLAGSSLTPSGASVQAADGPARASLTALQASTGCRSAGRLTAASRAAGAVLQGTPTPTQTAAPTQTATPTQTAAPTSVPPTPTVVIGVAFRSASAVRSKRTVLIRWRMASETNVIGFNVYCGVQANRVRRNKRLIAAHGSSRGHAYSFRDRVVTPRPGPYWIRVLHASGGGEWQGPIAVR